MITNISNQNQIAKNEATKDINKENIKEKLDKKTSINDTLKTPFFSKDEVKLPKDYVSKVDQKLQELLNKLLDQISTEKDPNLAILKNNKNLNFAPNIANDLKKLQSELSKIPEFENFIQTLEELIKPAKEANFKNTSALIKNSGIFLETKLNYALKEQNLPQSFFNLLNSIKATSNQDLKKDIAQLDLKNLDTTNTLKELIYILQNHKKENKVSLENTSYKTLFKLFDKLENFKNYINKDSQNINNKKIQNMANHFIKDLNKNLALINKELSKPENIKIQNTHILKDLSQNIKELINFLKDIKNTQNHSLKEPTNINNEKIQNKENLEKNLHKEQNELPKDEKNSNTIKDTKDFKNELPKEKIQNKENLEKNLHKEQNELPKDEKNSNTIKDTKDFKNENLAKEENTFINKSTNTTSNKNNFDNTFENIFKTNKNLNFSQNLQEELLTNLSKELNQTSKKLNEVLKALDLKNYDAKNSLDDIKNIEKKLELSIKDLSKITQKSANEINSDLQKDIKSTLLQISNLAKNLDNENVLNQTNRLITQLEFNQLLSLADNNIHTFLPFFWDDLEKSNVVFKRGKKDKFYAQINLEFESLGKINVFLSLNNDKYIDINMMIENIEFRKKLYERAHELKKSLVKVGLLSSNFFISDIIKNKFQNQEEYNDFNMGFDTKA
ncbi:flagellar hook-length control protein FliK [Campylobacter insulaenigrae]|uniref:flagellar hook-length control protein FliK n=1 Tax=Campylobacter insulaenigrae TaxID=260714 RepID=UPI0021526746|nr:flagellar hook-length control protein FliK [Campylobacter insulaenigrae]MCR6570843.1 flagellar hook-length control protein FliK [Campylobacter insulaenigrae]MCR6576870.1 flagellar hook-length control protein FliK [Campylobacter insulaenigrae]MCR6578408.1 flagellar hook-length control protein FliK [Campylobacter insulaenigrae]MCR6583126.1 flagellar hook-length control protein FliK [Campylobacter insulaenigrae]MCR6587533.1 flagellar hook-length control protein FliK [Campylobacter insulaenigra